MRLSDIKGERTLDVIAEIIEPIANIAEDEAAAELFRREKPPEGMSMVLLVGHPEWSIQITKSHSPQVQAQAVPLSMVSLAVWQMMLYI